MPQTIGFLAVLLLVGGLGSWSVGTEIAGAVVVPGIIKSEANQQVVEHPDGGVVGSIFARDGDHVKAGEILVRFENTYLQGELAIVEKQLFEILLRKARLEAEQNGTETIEYPNEDIETFNLDPDFVSTKVAEQEDLFQVRKASLAQELAQLREQRDQISNRILGINAQKQALQQQLEIVLRELADQETLREKGLVTVSRLLDLQKQKAQLEGNIGRLLADSAAAKSRISELDLESLRLTDRRREAAIKELGDLGYREIELTERRISLQEKLERLDVRSPVDGIVFGSRVTTLQSVIQPAEPMMYIVPNNQPLVISARVEPTDIDQIYEGQNVLLKFPTFDQRITPDIPGYVERISADTLDDDNTGTKYYEAILRPDNDILKNVEGISLQPGMPVEAFIKTGERTPLSYLTKPLVIYFDRAFKQ